MVLEEGAIAVAPRLVDTSSVEVSSVCLSGGEGVVVSLGGGVVISDGLGVVMMVSGGHVEFLPMNITLARCTQLHVEPRKGKSSR
jgi:hypothetical protein